MNREYLKEAENRSLFIIREAAAQFKNMAFLWSMGKDSTALLWLCRKSFFGKIPFPVVHIDTGLKFPQMYKFRNRIVKKWDINLIVAKNTVAIGKGVNPNALIKGDQYHWCPVSGSAEPTVRVKSYKIEAKVNA